MGKMAVVLKIMPEDAETDLDEIEEQVRERIKVDDVEREEVAFGLEALKVSTITTDEEGGTDHLENELDDMEQVQSIEVESFNKI